MALERLVSEGAAGLGVSLPPAALPGLRLYFERLTEAGRRLNLTAITDEPDVAVKHFVDSLTCLLAVDVARGAMVVDVGTGAGLPGLVLKLARPDLRLVLLDALRKRCAFLSETVAALGLDGVTVVHMRAEDAGRGPWREQAELAVARAVAPLAVLAEYCLPLVRVGGTFLAMKGPGGRDELAAAAGAMRKLGGGPATVTELTLPGGAGERQLIAVPKLRATPAAWPRRAGLAARQPLG